MGYDFGPYVPPPAAPRLPANLQARVPLPELHDAGTGWTLPAPPPEPDRRAGIAVDRGLLAVRTPGGDEWASYMDRRGATSMWWNAAAEMRHDLGPLKGGIATGMLVATQVAGLAASRLPANRRWQRDRPFEVDPDFPTIGQRPTNSSYPSGHARQAYAMARLVSRLDPGRVDEVYGLARQVADSRLYAGVHFPADVQAGAGFGTSIGDTMADATLRAESLASSARDHALAGAVIARDGATASAAWLGHAAGSVRQRLHAAQWHAIESAS